MTIYEAEHQTDHILARERKELTVHYESAPAPPAIIGTVYYLTPLHWDFLRDNRPRRVRLNPEEVEFKSDNVDLLVAIYDKLPEQDKPLLISRLAMRICKRDSFHHKPGEVRRAGTAQQCSSELPAIAEFLVRKGGKPVLLKALHDAEMSPGLTLMLRELEDMIAFNFTVFTDEEYGELANCVQKLEHRFGDFTHGTSPRGTVESNTFFHLQKELPEGIRNIKEVIEQARVAHIKRSTIVPKSQKVKPALPIPGPPKLTILDTLAHLHADLRSYGHYFSEEKRKEAVAAAFQRVGNRLNEIRDASSDDSVKGITGYSVVHKLFTSGILDLPYQNLSPGNPKSKDAFREQLRAFLSSGVGWFRNSFSHEPHNLPELSEWEALELLFIASHMLKLIDLSLASATKNQPSGA